jgi:ParB-like chromosome segregation protein Spo0J
MATIRRKQRLLSIQEIKPNPRNARNHSNTQIRQITESMKACGFCVPVLLDETPTLFEGHHRRTALLSIPEISAIVLRGSPGRPRKSSKKVRSKAMSSTRT